MNKRERVIAAIRQEATDGIPSCFSMHFPEECANGEEAVKAHLDFLKATDVDILKIMNENLYVSNKPLLSAADYGNMEAFHVNSPFMKRQMELVKRILDKVDGDVFSIGTLHSVGTSAMYHPFKQMGYGYDQARSAFDGWVKEHEDVMLETVKRITEGMCELAREYVRCGLDGVFVASLGAERRFGLSREQFSKWVGVYDQMIMEAIKAEGGYCFLHVCNRDVNLNYYDDYNENLYDVANWGTFEVPCSLKEGRDIFKGKTIMGGLANRTGVLSAGSEDGLINTVTSVVNTFGRKGFILGADCTVATGADLSRLKLAVETARKL